MKRKIFTCLLIVFGTTVISVHADDWQGKGTKTNPYKIATQGDLKRLATQVNDEGHIYVDTFFVQTADIDLKNEPWTPIGKGHSKKSYVYFNTFFEGNYNGQGFRINNFFLNGNYTNEMSSITYPGGLFGMVKNGTFENIMLASGNIVSKGDCIDFLGGIIGSSYGDSIIIQGKRIFI